jgi:hypothetical protein
MAEVNHPQILLRKIWEGWKAFGTRWAPSKPGGA